MLFTTSRLILAWQYVAIDVEKHVFRTTLKLSSLVIHKDHPAISNLPYQCYLMWSHLGERTVGISVRIFPESLPEGGWDIQNLVTSSNSLQSQTKWTRSVSIHLCLLSNSGHNVTSTSSLPYHGKCPPTLISNTPSFL